MSILSQFIRLLEWLENLKEFCLFLIRPTGLCVIVTLYLFFSVQVLYGCDTLTAATLSSTAALTLFCILEKPNF